MNSLLPLTALFVGFAHSLIPAHWVPIVLISKANRWNLSKAMTGALVLASGHLAISVLIAVSISVFGNQALLGLGHELEEFSATALLVMGLVYTLWAFWQHYKCAKHSHHHKHRETSKRSKTQPYLFLFLVGQVPCFAVVPTFIVAAPAGIPAVAAVAVFFSVGVISALLLATLLSYRGLKFLDNPILEHYGDVITGLALVFAGSLMLYLH